MQATAAAAPPRSATPKLRRIRVALGTLIAIEAAGPGAEPTREAVAHAFATVTRLHVLLHPNAADSDLARINRNPAGTAVHVHEITFELLRLARELCTLSAGVFDPCLPHRPGRLRDLELLAGQRVIAHVPVALDFGGFAKGYAIDAAVAALLKHGCWGGLVNAGGDLRAFGPEPYPVLLRRSDGSLDAFELSDSALAVSDADSEDHPPEHQGYYSHESPDAGPRQRYAAVLAPTAVLADALSKCAMLCPQQTAASALRAFGAAQIVRSFGGRACPRTSSGGSPVSGTSSSVSAVSIEPAAPSSRTNPPACRLHSR